MSTLIDQQLGDYRITRFLGEGAEGHVYQAEDLTGNDRALKIYGPFPELRNLQGPLEEAKRQRSVVHDSIVQIDPPFIHPDPSTRSDEYFLCIPMPRAQSTAEQWHAFREKITTDHIDALLKLLDGVRAVHEAGLVHNDIKPSNLLLYPGPRGTTIAKLGDFGLARRAEDFLSVTHRTMGLSIHYAPPEQFVIGYTPAPVGDVYAFGATLYYLLTGLLSFELDGSNPEDWRRAHETYPRPDASEQRRTASDVSHENTRRCPARLALLVKRMMNPRPELRPSVDLCMAELSVIRNEIEGDLKGYEPSGAMREWLLAGQQPAGYGPLVSVRGVGGLFSPNVHQAFSRQLWWLQIPLSSTTWTKMGSVVKEAIHFFGDAFSIYETYGPFDMHLRVWSSERRMEKFKTRLAEIAAITPVPHRVADLKYSAHSAPQGRVSRTDAVALQDQLLALQATEPLPEFIVRRTAGERDWGIKAFTFVEKRGQRLEPYQHDALLDSMRDRVSRLDPELLPTLYSFTSACRYLCMLEYNCPQFDEVWGPPGVLLDERNRDLGSITQLVTNRLVHESDRLRL